MQMVRQNENQGNSGDSLRDWGDFGEIVGFLVAVHCSLFTERPKGTFGVGALCRDSHQSSSPAVPDLGRYPGNSPRRVVPDAGDCGSDSNSSSGSV